MNRAGRLNASNDLANLFNTIVCVPQCAAARVSTWVSKLIVPAALRPIRGRHILGIPDVVPRQPSNWFQLGTLRDATFLVMSEHPLLYPGTKVAVQRGWGLVTPVRGVPPAPTAGARQRELGVWPFVAILPSRALIGGHAGQFLSMKTGCD